MSRILGIASVVAICATAACTTNNTTVIVVRDDGGSTSSSVSTSSSGSAATSSHLSNGTSSGSASGGTAATDGGSSDATVDGSDGSDGASSTGDATVDGSDGATDASVDADGGTTAQRCDADGGNCRCFNIAFLGFGGATGADFGAATPGSNNTQGLVAYLNTNGNALVSQIGCGTDVGCTSPAKPTLTADFLSHYDVLVFQWMTDALTQVVTSNKPVGYQGNGYWSFTADELSALKTWVQAGGGVMVVSGFDYTSSEIDPANQILGELTDIQYTATDTFGATETGNAEYCLGDSTPVTAWAKAPDPLGQGITAVGAFHGRSITAGANATVDCNDTTYGVCAAHEDVGKGHVYAYTDEWITYVSQWDPATQPASYCTTGALDAGEYPAVQIVYQVPQFWYDAINYTSQATGCSFDLNSVPGLP